MAEDGPGGHTESVRKGYEQSDKGTGPFGTPRRSTLPTPCPRPQSLSRREDKVKGRGFDKFERPGVKGMDLLPFYSTVVTKPLRCMCFVDPPP